MGAIGTARTYIAPRCVHAPCRESGCHRVPPSVVGGGPYRALGAQTVTKLTVRGSQCEAVGSVGLDELQPQLPDGLRVDLADAGLGDEDLPDLGERQPLE